jgi:hypothetical protein
MLKNPRGAYVLGALALFVALGGTAVANDSVRALVTGADVRNGSLTGRDVRNRSLTRADLAPGVLKAGPAGPAGPAGAQGERGPAGPDLAGATHVRVRGDRAPADNGAALRAAVASITDASDSKPYVIQLAPGIYDLLDTQLTMKPDVSIAGAGAPVTRITGDLVQSSYDGALVLGADRTSLSDVTIVNRGAGTGVYQNAVAVTGGAAMRIEDAVLQSETTAKAGYALVTGAGASVDVHDSRLVGSGASYAMAADARGGAVLRIRGSELVATAQLSAHAARAEGAGSAVMVEHSALLSNKVAVGGSGGALATVGASRVVGRALGTVTCVASYDNGFTPLDAACN